MIIGDKHIGLGGMLLYGDDMSGMEVFNIDWILKNDMVYWGVGYEKISEWIYIFLLIKWFTSTPIDVACGVLLCDIVLGSALIIWWMFFAINERVFGCEVNADMEDVVVGALFLPCKVEGFEGACRIEAPSLGDFFIRKGLFKVYRNSVTRTIC